MGVAFRRLPHCAIVRRRADLDIVHAVEIALGPVESVGLTLHLPRREAAKPAHVEHQLPGRRYRSQPIALIPILEPALCAVPHQTSLDTKPAEPAVSAPAVALGKELRIHQEQIRIVEYRVRSPSRSQCRSTTAESSSDAQYGRLATLRRPRCRRSTDRF